MSTLSRIGALAFAALAVGVPTACKKAPVHSYLQDLDMQDPASPAFNPNDIVSRAVLEDSSVDRITLFALLTHGQDSTVDKKKTNPYLRDSFLSRYYSNGFSAFDALLNTADAYRINPLVLVVRAETAQGLVGLDSYPVEDPSRVEYVFGCGCSAPGHCDDRFAGFDRQLDCLAREYRMVLDDLDDRGGTTAGGWRPGTAATTLDGQSVTPKDEGTAVAYQIEPRVGDHESGNRLFWTVLQLYMQAIQYQPPSGATAVQRSVGEPCAVDGQCKFPGGRCLAYRGGMCTKECAVDADCPQREGRVAHCIPTQGGRTYCFVGCNPNIGASCRNGEAGWACCTGTDFAGTHPAVCQPVRAEETGCPGGQ